MLFSIRINTGDDNITTVFYFVHKDSHSLSQEQQITEFDKAVKELDHIYKDYGRFATSTGVVRLFKHFGFEQTKP